MKELDSTQALLDSTIELVDSVIQDDSEEEVFFGKRSDKEALGGLKKCRRDTMECSGSASDWRSQWEAVKGQLSVSSASTGRSSLLDAENSIIEEEEEDVFEDSPSANQQHATGEIEFFQCTSSQDSLDLDTTPASLEISGIQPLPSSQSIDVDDSASGIYDSFSDATKEEMLDQESEGEEAEKLAHVKRKILQDSTFMSSVSCQEEGEGSDGKELGGSPSQTPHLTSITVTPASPESLYVTAPSSRRNTSEGGAASPMFDTTVEEMALYDMYGEDYDEVVAAMTKQEKIDLRKKLESRGEEERMEIQLKFEQIANAEAVSGGELLSVGSTMSPFSLNSSEGSNISPFSRDSLEGPPSSVAPETRQEQEEEPMEECETPPEVVPPQQGPMFTSNYMLPTAASLGKLTARSPSPSPRKKLPWLPPSPSPSKAFMKSPHSSARKPTVSRLPQPVKVRPGLAPQVEASPGPRTPLARRAAGLKSAYAAVASPVAAYVKNNPAPHLVQNVKAKEPENPLESTMVEVEEKEKENNARLSLLPQCPLPSAVYKAGSVVAGKEELGKERDEYEYVTEAYGAVSQSAKVTRHVSRVQLPSNGLSWNDDLLAYDESCNSSPSVAKFKLPGKSVLKTTRRDSGLFDESMMNVSVVETKVVKKVARGKGGARGRGKGKGKQRLIDRNPYH